MNKKTNMAMIHARASVAESELLCEMEKGGETASPLYAAIVERVADMAARQDFLKIVNAGTIGEVDMGRELWETHELDSPVLKLLADRITSRKEATK